MANPKQREDERPHQAGDAIAAMRAKARADLFACVKRMSDEKHLLRHLGDLPDLEMMEAATDLTLKK